MSEAESGPGAPSESHECEEGTIWDEAQGKCVPVAEESSKDPSATGEVTAGTGLTPRIERTVKEYFAEMEGKFKRWMKEEVQRLKKESEAEAEEALRKSFGLAKDPVLHRSDLAKLARTMQLENTTSGKRSPASPGATGPEGNTKETKGTAQSKAVDSLLKEYGVKK